MTKSKHTFFYRNGLSIAVTVMMLISMSGQYISGWKVYNEDRAEWGQAPVSAAQYFTTGHFVSEHLKTGKANSCR